MSTVLLDFGASYNFNALAQLKQFAPNSKDWRQAKPLQIEVADKSSVISSHIAIFLYNSHLSPVTPIVVEICIVLKLS